MPGAQSPRREPPKNRQLSTEGEKYMKTLSADSWGHLELHLILKGLMYYFNRISYGFNLIPYDFNDLLYDFTTFNLEFDRISYDCHRISYDSNIISYDSHRIKYHVNRISMIPTGFHIVASDRSWREMLDLYNPHRLYHVEKNISLHTLH